MAKIVPERIIDRCLDCHNISFDKCFCNLTATIIYNNTTISEWCPLNNAPEPKDYEATEKNIRYHEYLERTRGGKQ